MEKLLTIISLGTIFLSIATVHLAIFPNSTAWADKGEEKENILGQQPDYLRALSDNIPQKQAITRKIWAPGLDEGFVPKGITWAEGVLYLSTYQSIDGAARGEGRIYKIDPASGKVLGKYVMPSEGHFGGIAWVGDGKLVVSDTWEIFHMPEDAHMGGLTWVGENRLLVADTRKLYLIDAEIAFSGADDQNAIISTVDLQAPLRGSFVSFDGEKVYLGKWNRSESVKSRLLPLSIFDSHKGETVTLEESTGEMLIPRGGQGAAYDKIGHLWLTFGGGRFGRLEKRCAETHEAIAKFDLPIGMEDCSFDDEGYLWTVSEAGCKRFSPEHYKDEVGRWDYSFPVIFRLDVDLLE